MTTTFGAPPDPSVAAKRSWSVRHEEQTNDARRAASVERAVAHRFIF
jgi:hypothetical protein